MSQFALHSVHFDFGSGSSFEIESALGRGKPGEVELPIPGFVTAEIESSASEISSGGVPPIRWLEAGELFERFQLREDTDYFLDVTVPLPLSETLSLAQSNPVWPFDARLSSVFIRDPAKRWKEGSIGGVGRTTVTGQLRLRSHAGLINFTTDFGVTVT